MLSGSSLGYYNEEFIVGLNETIAALVRLLADSYPPTRFGSLCPLRQHDLNLTQFPDDLFRLVLLEWHLSSLSWSRLS